MINSNSHISNLRLLLAVLLVFSFSRLASAQEPAKPARPAKSLDKQLLDDLDSDVPEKIDVAKPKASAKPDDLDTKLKPDLGEGEDIELGRPKDPLTKIGERMKIAEELIGKRNTSIKTQTLQREILTDLDALIARLEKQCQCAGGEQKPNKSQSNSQAKKSGPANSDSGEDSQKPAEVSTERIGKNDDAKVESEEFRELVRAVWGNLPARVRDQMQNASVEQFLPKYERLIEEYYKRLAEEK